METGDLLFTLIGRGDNAISAVTAGYRGARVNHVGVAVRNPRGMFILEAFPPEVRLTNIAVHLRRSKDNEGRQRYMIGRLDVEHRHHIPEAITYGLVQRDIPYDRLYLTDEDALYCSELVVDMFKSANDDTEFFEEHPMSFRDPASGETHPHWVAYYEYFGMEVPHGEPGSNPGRISLDPKLDIYHVEGPIAGYQEP